MMVSISVRCGAENSAALAMKGAAAVSSTAPARAKRRERGIMFGRPLRETLIAEGPLRRLQVRDVVGAHPGGRADGEAGLGARGELTRGADVAAGGGGLRRGEVGLGKIAGESVGHPELREGAGDVVVALDRRAQDRHGLASILLVAGGDQRLPEQAVDQRRIGATASLGLPPSSSACPLSS